MSQLKLFAVQLCSCGCLGFAGKIQKVPEASEQPMGTFTVNSSVRAMTTPTLNPSVKVFVADHILQNQ